MRNQDIIESLGSWERLQYPSFTPPPRIRGGGKRQAGANAFTMSPKKWIEFTNAIRENLVPPELTPIQITYTYVNEADMLNVV